MKIADFMRQLRGIINPHDRAARNQLSVFLVCLAISTFVWLLMSLSREYYSTVDYQLTVRGLPEDKILMNKVEDHLLLRVRGTGYDLASLDVFSLDRSVNIDVRDMKLKDDGQGVYTGFVRTAPYATTIARQLDISDEVTGISPDSLVFRFRDKVTKKLPVKPDLKYEMARQYWLSGPILISPDTIKISGLQSVLDTIDKVVSQRAVSGRLKDTTHITLPLIKPKTHYPLEYSDDSVKILIPVEQFTEVEMEVSISKPEDTSVIYRYFPEKVMLNCQVSFTDFNRINEQLFEIVAIRAGNQSSNSGYARLEVVRAPAFVKNIRLQPELIEYLIINK